MHDKVIDFQMKSCSSVYCLLRCVNSLVSCLYTF